MSTGEKVAVVLLAAGIIAFVGAGVIILEGWGKARRWWRR